MISFADAQTLLRRSRAEGFYKCESANTVGTKNLWVSARGVGFIWDDSPQENASTKIFPFLEVSSEAGILDFLSGLVESRILSYPWNGKFQFGSIGAGVKATLPNNKDLRLHGPGLEVFYSYNFQKEFSSIAGYRTGGSGFSPEGLIVQGGMLKIKALYDLDAISLFTWLPLKLSVNNGLKIPFGQGLMPFAQYTADAGISYVGLFFDAFVEYSFEGFFNKTIDAKMFRNELNLQRTWEVAFSENLMYITFGGRVRYPSGLTLYLSVPLLLSSNQGSSMTDLDRLKLTDGKGNGEFKDEWNRGITDPFDPWYAKWKIIGQISYPIMFRQTGAEMRRNFLLKKNFNPGKQIDIDNQLNLSGPASQGKGAAVDTATVKSDAARLEEIKKRRKQMEQSAQ
jgi:hypothetical protein